MMAISILLMAIAANDEQGAAKDAALKSFLKGADAVVAGVVIRVDLPPPPPPPPPRPRVSEHDPDLRRATVRVSDVAKGDNALVGKEVVVLFSNSEDVRWHAAPKLGRLDRGTFVLHGVRDANDERIRTHVYTAYDPRSFVKQKAPGAVKVDARYKQLLAAP